MFIRFNRIYELTDRQTPHDGIGHACMVSRGKVSQEYFPDLHNRPGSLAYRAV